MLYLTLSGTPLYNGIRHVLFTLPLLVILSALGFSFLLAMLNGQMRLIGQGILIVLLSFTFWHMIGLHPHQYTFFNQLFAGGIKKASQNYETDYWDNSYKEAVDWLHSESHLDEKKRRIFSASSSTRFLLDFDRFELVSHPWAADFYLVSTALDRHRVVPGDVLHVVRANEVPLLYVLRPNALRRNDSLFVGESIHRLAYLGSLYRGAGRKEDALKAFVHVLELDSKNKWVHVQSGELYLESDRADVALEHFQKAHDLMPLDANVLLKMGTCYEQLGQTEEALRLYVRAVELRSHFNPAYRSLGDLLSREKRYAEALVFYREIVDVFPESLGDWHRLGVALYHLGEFEAAAVAYRNLLMQDPDHADAWLNLAVMLYEQKKLDESLDAYRKVKELRPDDRKADQMMGKILMEQGQWDKAIEILGKLVQRDSLATDEWLLLAQAHRGRGDLDGAQMALAKYIKHHGNRQDGWLEYFELGKVYHKEGQVEVARVIYQTVTKVLPDNADVKAQLRALSQ
ncbi:MAG: tetratricopeptide repeat protein [Candidatus Latescibacteria bacterium]|nr:tetratricopeptide repeat protein [Candidatus Latescibacterota bacterium]